MSDRYKSLGLGLERITLTKIRCGAMPCPDFMTLPNPLYHWTVQGCCARHTVCLKGSPCNTCRFWTEETWIGFDLWIRKCKQRGKDESSAVPSMKPQSFEQDKTHSKFHKICGTCSILICGQRNFNNCMWAHQATTRTSSTGRSAPKSIYTHFSPPQDGSGDQTVLPHQDLTRSWRES